MSVFAKEVQELLLGSFILPERDGGLRPVLNLRPLNRYLKVLPFKMAHI